MLGLTAIAGHQSKEDNVTHPKSTFVFSGDSNLNSSYVKNNEIENKNNNESIQKEDPVEETKKSDTKVKEMISNVTEEIKEKNKLQELPMNDFTPEDEESARENGAFLSDDMEEAANNFANTEPNDENPEKETERKNIKKYQAEVINAMNHSGIYQKMDTSELESMQNIMDHSEEECYPDYSLPCPIDFFRTSSGCVPTKSYKGPCTKIQDKVVLLQDHQKSSWSEVCEVEWPCMPKECPGGSDYGSVCPVGWFETQSVKSRNSGLCTREFGSSRCGSELDLFGKTETEKRKLAEKCGLRWRCKSPIYLEDYESTCPNGWTPIGQYQCKAPETYEGDCPKIANLKKYTTEEMKKKVEVACLVNWPFTIHYQQFQRDFDIACPIGWSLLNNGICKAPENYKEEDYCKTQVLFGNMTVSQKESYSTACHVDFPFKEKENCKKDFSFECPLGWIPTNMKGYCKAPISYKSKICKNISKFSTLTESHLEFYKKSCNIEWPCEGEIQNSLIYLNVPVNFSNGNIRTTRSGAVDSESGLIV